MINAVTLLKRKRGLSVDEFQRYWRYEHAGVIARLPGFQRYAQSHPLGENYQGKEPVYDGVAELWAGESQVFREIAASEAYSLVQADEEKFLDRAAITLVLTDEHIIADGPVAADGVKCIHLLKRRPDLSVEAYQSCWQKKHGPLLAALPGIDRYVQYRARLGAYANGRQPAYDGFDVSWFCSIDALHNAMESSVFENCLRNQEAFLNTGECLYIMAREHVIIG